jgi:peroxiredoxin
VIQWICRFRLWALALISLTLLLPATAPAADAVKKPVAGKAPAKPAAGAKPAAKKPADVVQVAPEKLAMPKVVLTDAHAKTCLVKVGDRLPEITLTEPTGRRQPLAGVLGKRLTVVFFWQTDNPYAVEELADLQHDVAKPFGEQGVEVVAVNVRDGAPAVDALVKQLGITYPVLLDAEGKAFEQIASRRLPRTYLLDDQEKVLWFDLEYSASTRRDLRDAIRVALDTGK